MNYLLETYAMDYIIAKTDAHMMLFKQPLSKSPTGYAGAHWNKAIRCNRLYDDYVLKRILLRDYRIDPTLYTFILGSKEEHYSAQSDAQCDIVTKITKWFSQ